MTFPEYFFFPFQNRYEKICKKKKKRRRAKKEKEESMKKNNCLGTSWVFMRFRFTFFLFSNGDNFGITYDDYIYKMNKYFP